MRRSFFLGLALTLLAVSPAHAGQVTAQSGPVSATLSFDKVKPFVFQNVALAITRGGVPAYSGPIESQACGTCEPFTPLGTDFKGTLHVRDLDNDGEPEVMFDLWTGGAHCCVVLQVFQYAPATGTYTKIEHDFYDFGYSVHDFNRDGLPELTGADGRFDYAVTDFADSGAPIQIFDYSRGTFTDVTKSFKAPVRTDAHRWFRFYHQRVRSHGDVRGFLAAWAADEFNLGKGKHAVKVLRTAVRKGQIPNDFFGKAKTYVSRVLRLLRKTGYAR